MTRIIRVMFYFVFTVFGGLCGYSIARYTEEFFHVLSDTGRFSVFGALILLGILIGVTLAPVCTSVVVKAIDSLAMGLQKLTLQEVLMGSAGLLFGLIVAFFTNVALQQIDFSSIPAVGPYVGPFLIVVLTIFLACLGAFFGSRLVFIHSLSDLLGGSGTGGWGGATYLIDTSIIIDGRVVDVVKTGFIDGNLVVPKFVLDELQHKADSARDQERKRGRRGLDILDELRQLVGITVEEKDYPDLRGVDSKLVQMAQEFRAKLLTNDFNLEKVARLQNVAVLNINALASALKTVYLPGEPLRIELIREGKEPGQGVGFLDDGTMVVVERARKYVGETVLADVTSTMQTSAGKMIFARFSEVIPKLREVK